MATLKDQVATLTSLVETLIAQGAPVIAQASAPVEPVTFAKGKRDEAGNVSDGFDCTVAEPCSRKLRTAKRAAIHGVEAGGHDAR